LLRRPLHLTTVIYAAEGYAQRQTQKLDALGLITALRHESELYQSLFAFARQLAAPELGGVAFPSLSRASNRPQTFSAN
jgi:hypothetical protein